MRWFEVAVEASEEAAEAVSHILIEEGSRGVVEGTGRWIGYYPTDADLPAIVRRIERFMEGLKGFGVDAGPWRVTWNSIDDEDWAEAWKEHFHPLRIGQNVVVRPTWRAYEPRPGDVVVHLDPGMAFGTGGHPTTSLCIEALEDLVEPGTSMFDVGTGSGILAIVAAKLGAKSVEACDVDGAAVDIARQNVQQNGVRDRVRLVVGSWPTLVQFPPADLVVANIVAEVIAAMADDAVRLVKPGGRFVASGIVRQRRDEALSALTRAGWRVEREASEGEWVLVVARAPA